MSETTDRVQVIFKGEVQGVGFRYAALRVADHYPEITGMIRNLPDNTVELIAEGARKDIELMISDIHVRMNTYILDISSHWSNTKRQYKSFVIGF